MAGEALDATLGMVTLDADAPDAREQAERFGMALQALVESDAVCVKAVPTSDGTLKADMTGLFLGTLLVLGRAVDEIADHSGEDPADVVAMLREHVRERGLFASLEW